MGLPAVWAPLATGDFLGFLLRYSASVYHFRLMRREQLHALGHMGFLQLGYFVFISA